MNVIAFHNNVAEVDSNPVGETAGRYSFTSLRYCSLDVYCALNGRDSAREFHQQSIAHGLYETTVALADPWTKDFLKISLEAGAGPFLVGLA
jgi:hypothetical protein